MKVWVDTESGTYGVDDDDNPSVYVVELADTDYQLDEWNEIEEMSDTTRASWAKVMGIPLRMVGCRPKNDQNPI